MAFVTVRQFSNALGIVEVSIAILIGLRHWSARRRYWQRSRRPDVPDDAFVLVFNSRMGAEPRRVSCSFRSGRAILNKGCGSAWRCNMVAGRSIGPGMLSPTQVSDLPHWRKTRGSLEMIKGHED